MLLSRAFFLPRSGSSLLGITLAASKRGLSVGIVGVPNVGKSTLFNALTESQMAAASNYPFCTIDPNIKSIAVPDPNLELLDSYFKSNKQVGAEIKLVDIAGLVRGASRNQGLGNKFLSNIRQVDAILHCVRCFQDDTITHVEGGVDPARDIDIINTELLLSDLETVQNSIERVRKKLKSSSDRETKHRLDFLEKCLSYLSKDQPALMVPIDKDSAEEKFAKELGLLTAKKVIFVANVDEDQLQACSTDSKDERVRAVEAVAARNQSELIFVSAKVESELFGLERGEKMELLASYGMKEPALAALARKSYDILGLQSFYTAGNTEVRAWSIVKGTQAAQAAGVIHSDIEKGFIRAETYSIPDLVTHGSLEKIKSAGKIRSEGKEYVLKEDDVVHFLFNVSKSKK